MSSIEKSKIIIGSFFFRCNMGTERSPHKFFGYQMGILLLGAIVSTSFQRLWNVWLRAWSKLITLICLYMRMRQIIKHRLRVAPQCACNPTISWPIFSPHWDPIENLLSIMKIFIQEQYLKLEWRWQRMRIDVLSIVLEVWQYFTTSEKLFYSFEEHVEKIWA